MDFGIHKIGALVIERLDKLYESNWKFNLFCINKAINELVNEGKLSGDLVSPCYDALTRHVEAEAAKRRQSRRA